MDDPTKEGLNSVYSRQLQFRDEEGCDERTRVGGHWRRCQLERCLVECGRTARRVTGAGVRLFYFGSGHCGCSARDHWEGRRELRGVLD
eukprot:3324036-Rhodomonas_salina.1